MAATDIGDQIALSRLLTRPIFFSICDEAGRAVDAVAFEGVLMQAAHFYALLALAAFGPKMNTAPNHLGRKLWIHQCLLALNGRAVDTDELIAALRGVVRDVEGLRVILEEVETETYRARQAPLFNAELAQKLRPAFSGSPSPP